MTRPAPITQLPHGPLTIYLASLDGAADLSLFVRGLPADCPVMWLDSARHHAVTGRWSMVGVDPWMTLIARGDRIEWRTSATTHRWRAHPLEALRALLRRYQAAPGQPFASVVGLMGWLSYELNRWIERLPPPHAQEQALPEMGWCGMRVNLLVDHRRQRSWVVSVVDPHRPASAAHREAVSALHRVIDQWGDWCQTQEGSSADAGTGDDQPPWPSETSLRATTTQAAFEAMVACALACIRAGDIFQANLSQQFTMSWSAPAWPLYQALRRINPSPFACFLSWDDLAVVSGSPERLVRVHGGRIETRPIAGTRPRGATPVEDAMHSLDLLLSEKERAEHVMLVDLARNDLGRVCATGSVRVGEFMTIEEYSHVQHIVSNVAGSLRPGADAVEVIRSLFPGGTITGCPKVRCMQIIQELEPVPRGLYTGSLGYVGFDGTMDLNIVIRTMVIQRQMLSLHVGAGIVADSQPDREYQETLAKAAALMHALRKVGGSLRATGQRKRTPVAFHAGF